MSLVGRVFAVLLLVALPPLLIISLLFVFEAEWVERLGYGTTLLLVAALAIGWAAIMSLVTSRWFGRDIQALVDLAERGPSADAVASDAQRRLRAALDERNRQLAQLASHVRAVPITDSAPEVVRRVVAAVREVMGNATWSLAVLQSADESELPPAAYPEHGEVEPLTELHRWASVTAVGDGPDVRHIIGPWGAFVVTEIGAEGLLRGVLLAPWEGRAEPSRSERDLLLLVANHASLAIEHSLLYARVRAQADELDRMGALQRDFLRGVTHDLQTPLTSIRAVASELRATPDLPASAVADLSVVEHQADRLRRMVAQLLAVSRLEAGVLETKTDVLRVAPLVRRTWEALRADRPFTLRETGEPHLAVADGDRLEQVLWALLDNAVKYSPGSAAVDVALDGFRSGDTLRSTIEIRDHGVGMDRETRRRAFEQFYRSDVARTMAPDGSGIGLYAARGLVANMGGELEVYAPANGGPGTILKITLQAEPVAEPAART
jgi:K+-sensing histidine kinase KdpD